VTPHDASPKGEDALTLSTMCCCGHPRKEHRGLRMEVAGPCLECGCDAFARAGLKPEPSEQTMINARLDQVERLQRIVARLRGQLRSTR
jgi:hypothetical protein